MKIAISAESAIDMSKDLLEKFDIHTVPFTVCLDESTSLDGELDNEQLFDFFDTTKRLPKTSAVNQEQYKNHFENLLKNYDVVIHFALSSKISSACSNAQAVASEMKNVYVIDTLLFVFGIGLLAMKAREMANKNFDAKEILYKCEQQKLLVRVSLIVNKLNYIVKGGRCSALACFGANLLSIKPQILVENGKTKLGKKFIGNIENCAKKYCEDILKNLKNIDKKYVFLSYTTIQEKTKNAVLDILKSKGFENIYCSVASSTIACHTGPEALGVIFMEG